MRSRVRRILGEIVDLWLPPGCAGCGRDGPSPCPECLDRLTAAEPSSPPSGLDGLAALLRYDDASRPFVAALKYRGRRSIAGDFSRPLAALIADVRLGPVPPVVTWAPTTRARRRRRGYDQAEVLARAVAAEARSPVRSLVRRVSEEHQTGRGRRDRLDGVRFEPVVPAPAVVVVCDDVTTTGATLAAVAGTLRRAGAFEVHGLVLARTPVPAAVAGPRH